MKENIFKVVLVEDNPDLRDDLSFQLKLNNIDITAVADAIELDEYLSHSVCDIAIIDIGLPGEDGLSITARLRKSFPDMGIIILTASSELDSRLSGFEQGTDIYFVKPVDWRELVAQLNALYRRMQTITSKQQSDCWVLRHAGRELISPSGIAIDLSHNEAIILTILAKNSGQVVTRQNIIEHLDPKTPYDYDPRRLEVSISRIRHKINTQLQQSNDVSNSLKLPLKTARGKGYMFTELINFE